MAKSPQGRALAPTLAQNEHRPPRVMPPAEIQAHAPISEISVDAYRIPTDQPESDGTLEWDSTTLVTVHIKAADVIGFGYTYAHFSAASVIQSQLAPVLQDQEALETARLWSAMTGAIRNQGQCGLAMMAISAVDAALWDLKGKLLNRPLASLLGQAREALPLYGSGGFTSYSDDQLRDQLGNWVANEGMKAVKMKVGREPERDLQRVRAARASVGDETELFVDANSAYDRKQALRSIEEFDAEARISWMEQPLDPDDLPGLRLLRDRSPSRVDIADGEYGYRLADFRRFIEAGAVDVVMPDATRCGGITGLLKAGALCESYGMPVSTHCAPSLHLHPCCCMASVRHAEYFHDHARIEAMLFDGFRAPENGAMTPDLSRPGLGVELKRNDASQYAL